MRMQVDLANLNALAAKIEGLEKDIFALSDRALRTANIVIDGLNANADQPLKAACRKAVNSVCDAKKLTHRVCGELSRQTEILRGAVVSYASHDKIDAVNE
jgi:hypothetical protein